MHITFGTGELIGPTGKDDFHIGSFSVKEQSFKLIRKEIGDVFKFLPFEGILGLGFPSMSAGSAVPFFDNVIQQKVLRRNEFAFFFSRDISSPNALLWGGVDRSLYHGKIILY